MSHESIATLREALDVHSTLEDLRPLARLFTDRPPTRKPELVELLLAQVKGESLKRLWGRLGDVERVAVAEVVHSSETRLPVERLRAKYGKVPESDALKEYGPRRSPTALSLFFFGGVMPDDLKERLKAFVPPPKEATLEALEAAPAVFEREERRYDPRTKKTETRVETLPVRVREMEGTARRELVGILRLIDARKVSVSEKSLRPTAASTRAIATVLEGGDFFDEDDTRVVAEEREESELLGAVRAFAWPMIAQAAGLAKPSSGGRLELTKTGRAALAAPPHEIFREALERWKENELLDELNRVDTIQGQSGRGRRDLIRLGVRRVPPFPERGAVARDGRTVPRGHGGSRRAASGPGDGAADRMRGRVPGGAHRERRAHAGALPARGRAPLGRPVPFGGRLPAGSAVPRVRRPVGVAGTAGRGSWPSK